MYDIMKNENKKTKTERALEGNIENILKLFLYILFHL